jgi:16S rRNA (uracil1498-N3)-methyltransferase
MLQTPAEVDAKAHVLVDDVASVMLSDEHHHHLARVLRLRSGDCVTVTNGRGSWRCAVLGSGWPNRAEVEWTSEIFLVSRRLQPVAVGFALTKGDKPETVVQKLAELGVDRIAPFVAEHSVAKWDAEKATRNVARLRVIAAEALQQSRQAWLSQVSDMASLSALLAHHRNGAALEVPNAFVPGAVDDAGNLRVVSDSPGGGGSANDWIPDGAFGLPARADRGGQTLLSSATRFVLIGPEGGWSAAERELLPEAVGIASAVLRAETAAIVAGALLVQRRIS